MPDLRKDPIVGRWVIIADERAKRPHDFKSEAPQGPSPATCPFCEGHEEHTPPEIVTRLGEVGAAWAPDPNRPPLPAQPPQIDIPYDPAGSTSTSGQSHFAIDGLDEMAPYYSRVEQVFRVQGRPEGLAQYPDGNFVPDTSPWSACMQRYVDAGTKLGVNASTISRRLESLEASVGAHLFDRTPEGVLPTAVAEALGPHAEAMERAASGLRLAAEGRETEPEGEVRLAASPSVGQFLVAPALPRLFRRPLRRWLRRRQRLAAGNRHCGANNSAQQQRHIRGPHAHVPHHISSASSQHSRRLPCPPI